MLEGQQASISTLALSTKVEEDFVSPLTAVRGALEILRDFPDLAVAERHQFVETALRGCAKLENGVKQLAETVYDAGQPSTSSTSPSMASNEVSAPSAPANPTALGDRIRFLDDLGTVEINLANLRFRDSAEVNAFYDLVDARVERTRHKWFFIVDYTGCAIWPEAWVAFAHRAKKVNANYSNGTARFRSTGTTNGIDTDRADPAGPEPEYFTSRDAALARIHELQSTAGAAATRAVTD